MAVISVSTPLFIQSAEDLVVRLTPIDNGPARAMLIEANELLVEFRRWEHHKPPDEVRVRTIKRLFDLQRRVLDHVARP